jgi:hypothetical protein
MKKLRPYNGDSFDVHTQTVSSKHKCELKDRLIAINPLVKNQFDVYSSHFSSNSISSVTSDTELAKSKDDLLTLYKYQSKTIRQVRENIRRQQVKTIISTCQNCTVDSANSLDHILPKSSFPEFIVNPINLFPCCTTCNSHKFDAIENDSGQKFLNLYLDDLPNNQYLFLDISLDENKELDFSYYLENPDNKISLEFYSVIENHYNKLHLFERFKLKSIEYLSELESKISAFRRRLSLEDIILDLTTAIDEEKEAYGHNHWKCILESTLINSHLFMYRFE